MAAIADDEPPSRGLVSRQIEAQQLWVACADDQLAVAYLMADVLGEMAHIDQVSVHPDVKGHGLGAGLIDHLETWARIKGLSGLSLTTFEHVPWNAPYYARLGFRVLQNAELPGVLQEVVAKEAALGLNRWPRVCMFRPVTQR